MIRAAVHHSTNASLKSPPASAHNSSPCCVISVLPLYSISSIQQQPMPCRTVNRLPTLSRKIVPSSLQKRACIAQSFLFFSNLHSKTPKTIPNSWCFSTRPLCLFQKVCPEKVCSYSMESCHATRIHITLEPPCAPAAPFNLAKLKQGSCQAVQN